MTGTFTRSWRFRGPRLGLAIGLVTAAALGVWAQQPPERREPRGPGRAGPESRAKGLTKPGIADVRPFGTRLATIMSHGADPRGQAIAQQTAFQAAHDSLLSQEVGGPLDGGVNRNPGTVWVPSGTYVVNKPIWLDGDYIELRGEGRYVSNIKCLTGCPALILGHRRRALWNRNLRSDEAILVGTCKFTHDSKTVTGTGTLFRQHFHAFKGYPLLIRDRSSRAWYSVASVESDTSLTLATSFREATTTANYNRGIDYLKRIPNKFAADHRMDLWNGGRPKLDSSLVTGAGQRFGLTSKSPTSGSPFADHWIAFPYAPPATGLGDCWETSRALTIDFCIEGQNGGSCQGYLFGMGQEQNPAPWWLTALHGNYQFTFSTKEGTRDQFNSPRVFTFGDATKASGVQRIAIQIDFTTNDSSGRCAIRAWINGKEQTIARGFGTQQTTTKGTDPSFTAADNLHFASGEPGGNFSFYAGLGNAYFWDDSGYPSSRGTYWLYGFRLTNGTRYDTAGGVQVRLDGGPLDDSFRYTGSQEAARVIAYLDTTDPPAADYDGRLVSMIGGAWTGNQHYYGLFLYSSEAENTSGYTKGTTISDLSISGGSSGPAVVLVGPVLDPLITNINIYGNNSWVGIGGDVHSVYDIRLRDLLIGDTRCAWIAAHGWICEIENLWRAATGRFALRFDGCSVKCRNVRMGDLTGTEAYIKITGYGAYGSQYTFDTIDSDNEGKPNPTLAFLYCERHNSSFTSLECTNFNPGSIPATVPMIKLVDRYPLVADGTPGPGKFHGYNLLIGRIGIETDGPGWEGFVENIISSPTDGNQWRKHTGADGESNVVVYHRMDSLPTAGTWQKNAHVIELRHPKSGQAQRYLCTQSGTVGGNPAPVFTALTPLLP